MVVIGVEVEKFELLSKMRDEFDNKGLDFEWWSSNTFKVMIDCSLKGKFSKGKRSYQDQAKSQRRNIRKSQESNSLSITYFDSKIRSQTSLSERNQPMEIYKVNINQELFKENLYFGRSKEVKIYFSMEWRGDINIWMRYMCVFLKAHGEGIN